MMKPIYLMLCLLLVVSTLVGCSKDDDVNPYEIPYTELPASADLFLKKLFPGQQPLSVEKAMETEKTFDFKVTYPESISIYLDKAGNWLQINFPNGTIPDSMGEFKQIALIMKTTYNKNTLVRITHTTYGACAVLDNNQMLAFSDTNSYWGKELGAEGYTELPENIRSFIKQFFTEAHYKHIIIDSGTSSMIVPRYRVWLDNNCILWFNYNGEWENIDGQGELLPLTLINILPEKVRQSLGSVKTLYRILHKSEFLYEIWLDLNHSTTYNSEEKPPVNLHQKEIKEFIDTYFGTISGHSITVPLQEQNVYYLVKLPNGFDFRLDEALEWDLIDGHGYPFGEKQKQLIPKAILQYIANNVKPDAQSDITTAKREYDSYKLIFTNGTLLQFNLDGTFEGEHTNTSTAYEKAYNYIRYTYPKDYGVICRSWEELTFLLSDGTKILFDKEGNLIK